MRAEWIAAVSWLPLILLSSGPSTSAGSPSGEAVPPDPGGVAEAGAPAPAPERGTDVVGLGLTAGFDHTCQLLEGGALRCWGANDRGQVGDGSDSIRVVPVPVGVEGLTFSAVSAGHKRTCGIVIGGPLYCWGMQTARIPGEAMGPPRLAPVVEVDAPTFTSVSVGTQHACGLTAEGVAHCWGRNHAGELGDGTTESRSQPTPVVGDHRFAQIAVGGDHTCGLTDDGTAFCWGSNDFGEVGSAGEAPGPVMQPRQVAGEQTFAEIAAALNRTCGLTSEGAAFCWGSNGHGALGDGTTDPRPTPTAVVGDVRFETLTVGNMHTCGLSEDGTARCWGFNGFGELGDGTMVSHPEPTPVAGEHLFAYVAAGAYHTCGIPRDGAGPLCWGRDPSGGIAGPNVIRIVLPTPLGAQGVAGGPGVG